MATLPALNYATDSARTEGEFKAAFEALLAGVKQIPGAAAPELALTISGGAITPPGSGGILVVDTEAAASTDDLTNIVMTNYPDNATILVRNANASRSVVLRHASTGSGQMFLERGARMVLDDTLKYILLARRGNDLYEVCRGPQVPSMLTVAKSSNFTITAADHGKVFLCTGNITVNFDPAANIGNGFVCGVVNVETTLLNVTTLRPNGFETIDGVTQFDLPLKNGTQIVCNGSAFYSTTGFLMPKLKTATFGATLSVDPNQGEYFEVSTLTGNVTTFNLNTSFNGRRVKIRFAQDATGGRTVAAPSGAKIAGSLATTALQVSHLDLIYVGGGVNRWEGAWTQIPL
ncbi:MAG: hypothetical protein JSR31_05950 [Nitrospira sp.]|nr:hypothetical protein [Nitrospira sp.]